MKEEPPEHLGPGELEGTEKRRWELADPRRNTGVNYRSELHGDTSQVKLPGWDHIILHSVRDIDIES